MQQKGLIYLNSKSLKAQDLQQIVSLDEDMFTEVNDLIIVMKLTNYRVDVFQHGTRLVVISFSNDEEKIKINLNKYPDNGVHLMQVFFSDRSKKERINDLFKKDMQVMIKNAPEGILVFTYIQEGMISILQKIKWL
jgi:hypothetical protein